jgi:hypothetical protein
MPSQLLSLQALTFAVLLVAGIRCTMAGDSTAPVPIPRDVPPAPIGHREPRPSELPRGILEHESAGRTAGQKAIDRKLETSICKNC